MKTFAALYLALAIVAGAAATRTPADKSVREAPAPSSAQELGVGRLVADFEIAPLSGRKFRVADARTNRATVIAFHAVTCPISKRYASTLAALERKYAPLGVRFIFVDPLAADTRAQIDAAIRAHGFTGPFVHDLDHTVRDALAARSTTEAFVLDAARTLVYRGAVDDQYGLGYSLDAPKQRYLAEALDAVLSGGTPRTAATSAPGCALEIAAQGRAPAPVDFHGRISRLMQQHCQECHRVGGVAPFPLVTYQDVAGHAGMIRKMVEKDLMPPWFAARPEPGHASPWANDRTLPAADKRDLLAWIAGGKPEGQHADAPLPRAFAKDWEIGTPDVVVQIPQPITVKATGRMPYQNVFVDTSFKEDRWVRALEVRPTAREVVHHVLVFILPRDTNATATAGARRRVRSEEGGNFFAAYVPGNSFRQFEPGYAKLLPAGATLHFQIHYTPSGTTVADQTRLGLVFAKEAPQHEVRVAGVVNPLFRIPPGAANHRVDAVLPVPFEATLMSFMPHMHLRGKAFRYELARADGTKQLLLDVPRFDFNWQLQYQLAEPLRAPIGSRILATGWFDNSAANPANPDPKREVKWGPQTEDEMMLGYVEYYVTSAKAGERSDLGATAARDIMFNVLDKNSDGKISREEAPSAESFRLADTNRDGSVTREELREFLKRGRGQRSN
jgi:thiol-disulfide isomerase/thioredoxin/mono/diheme cytochrome c family protein